MADMQERDDIPLNKALLMGAGVIAGAFALFQITGCTERWLATPAYVQALQACKDVSQYPVEIKREGVRTEPVTINVQISPEILATIEKCHDVVRTNFHNAGEAPGIIGGSAHAAGKD
jgi:hypothetical protein